MRKICGAALALALVGCLTSPLLGQAVRQGGGVKIQPLPGTGVGVNAPNLVLVNDKGVRAELKVTEEQARKLDGLPEKQKEALTGLRGGGQEAFQKYQEALAAIKKDLETTLLPAQVNRLRQLEVQQRGLAALFDPQLVKNLDLTNEQRLQVTTIVKNQSPKMREIFKDFQGNQEEVMKKVAELNRNSLEEAIKVLTPEQQRKYREAAGEPYKGTLPGGFGTSTRVQPLPGGIQPLPIQGRPIQIQPIQPRRDEK